jgi:copper chaperone NosL
VVAVTAATVGTGARLWQDGLALSAARLRHAAMVLFLAPLLLTACAAGPEPLHVGTEECAHCSMVISDRRYAAQLVTAKGRSHKFDSIECMTRFLQDGAIAAGDTRSLWVMDVTGEAEDWLAVADAQFVHSAALRTPMGGGLAAYASGERARDDAAALNGHLLDWDAVLQLAPAGH